MSHKSVLGPGARPGTSAGECSDPGASQCAEVLCKHDWRSSMKQPQVHFWRHACPFHPPRDSRRRFFHKMESPRVFCVSLNASPCFQRFTGGSGPFQFSVTFQVPWNDYSKGDAKVGSSHGGFIFIRN
ncbi:unnamed protein product [Durusdinium trenchii]|uniref:Uncharacterized protein n=1 Tax=Durusdinium trenchii TaxID=1381693 RepID=A0ABP0SWK9_9DINO